MEITKEFEDKVSSVIKFIKANYDEKDWFNATCWACGEIVLWTSYNHQEALAMFDLMKKAHIEVAIEVGDCDVLDEKETKKRFKEQLG